MKLKCSKTDPFRAGVAIFLGHTDNVLCPVAAVLAYLVIHPQAPGPLLCLKMAATSQESTWWPTFVWACVKLDWRQTDIAVTVLGLEWTLPQLKLEWKILIKMLGRWESASYQHYVRTPRDQLAAISSRLACMQ